MVEHEQNQVKSTPSHLRAIENRATLYSRLLTLFFLVPMMLKFDELSDNDYFALIVSIFRSTVIFALASNFYKKLKQTKNNK